MAAWWTFSTPTKRYFLRRGRGKAVVDEAPGQSFSGVLVSDCYAKDKHSSPRHGLHSAGKRPSCETWLILLQMWPAGFCARPATAPTL